VGPATLKDFRMLGIRSVPELAKADPADLYARLCEMTGMRHDPCCEDVFRAAVEQARNPELPIAQRQWWYWSRLRRATSKIGGR
jgi:nucleotidyltransferase/DNA polymerase involved in DNA repair